MAIYSPEPVLWSKVEVCTRPILTNLDWEEKLCIWTLGVACLILTSHLLSPAEREKSFAHGRQSVLGNPEDMAIWSIWSILCGNIEVNAIYI